MNILIKDVNVLTMKDNDSTIKKTNILIEENKVAQVGDLPKDYQVDKIIDGNNKLALPGLVNGHTHVAMSLFRNYADDLPFWPWLTEKIMPVEEKLVVEHVYWGSMLSIVEMVKSGITSFSDMYFFMDETARAVEESGVRACLTRGLTDIGGDGEPKLEETREFYNRWHKSCNERITIMAGPHAPYTCSPEYLYKVADLAKELNIGVHIHLSESVKEVEDSYSNHGKSPIKHVNDIGLFDNHTLAAHCVHLSDEDIAIMSEKKVNVVNNPGSNLKLGNGFAPVEKMITSGVNVALGTDGSASNNNLNMFEEINLAALINKGINQDSTSIPAMTAVKMATMNGARALGLEKEIGSIETGKKADIILVDLDKPHFYPRFNLVSSLAYSAQASDVDTVIVDGKIIMENCDIKTVDVEKVIYNAEKIAKKLVV